ASQGRWLYRGDAGADVGHEPDRGAACHRGCAVEGRAGVVSLRDVDRHTVIARSAATTRLRLLCKLRRAGSPPKRPCEGGSNPAFLLRQSWIASRSLSSGAHSRDPLARNDGGAITTHQYTAACDACGLPSSAPSAGPT